MSDLIRRGGIEKRMIETLAHCMWTNQSLWRSSDLIFKVIQDTPAVDAVEVEEYNELREAFVDFVCSGIHNPAPYCKNKREGCIDNRGWCITERCIGFNPGGERRSK